MSILTTLAIPSYCRNEVTGRGYATFGDRSIEFGPYDDPHSAAAYDRTLARWLANGRQLPGPDDQAVVVPRTGPISFDAFSDELLRIYAPPLTARATLSGVKLALKCMKEAGCQTTADMTVATVAAVVAGRPEKNSPNTTRGTLRYCASACAYAEKMGYLRISPFKIRSVSSFVRATPSRGKKHASREEIRCVLDHMRRKAQVDGWRGWRAKRLYALTAFLAYTGARAGEIYYLQTADVDLEEGIIWIVSRSEHRTKTLASAAPIPMPPDLIPLAREWFQNRMSVPPGFKIDCEECPWVFPTLRRHRRAPWVSGGPGCKPRDRMKAVAAEAGVVGFGPLMLRHSMATHLLHWGAGAGMVKRLLRHTQERTAQQWYTHDDLPNLRAAVANVRF